MFSLPRGVDAATDVPLATAAWESPQAVERLAYSGEASLFVGAIPASENWPVLRKIYDRGGAVLTRIANSKLPPLERAATVRSLEKRYRQALLADCIPLGFDDDRHFITIAGTRSGKGTSSIIPNLRIYPGSTVCPDPKGDNATGTAVKRSQELRQEVFVLDFFGIADVPENLRATFNPMALPDPASPNAPEDIGTIIEGVVVPTEGKDAHWDESASTFLKGGSLHLITIFDSPTLFTLRRAITEGDREGWKKRCAEERRLGNDNLKEFLKINPTPFMYFLQEMRHNEAFDGIISAAAETLLACGENERGSVLATARRNLAFLDTLNPHFVKTLSGGGRTFSPDIFKTAPKGATLYICLPAERIGTHGRVLRLVISILLQWAYRDLSPPACGAPTLFLLEEFHSLGYMPVIEKAAGYAAGFGIKLWIILQNLQQIQQLYKNSWQVFLANAGAIQVFGISDPDTTSYVSKSLGEVEVIRRIVSNSTNYQAGQNAPSVHQKASGVFGPSGGLSAVRLALTALPSDGRSESQTLSESVNQQIQIVPLLRPDEIAIQFARETGASLLLIKGRKPIWCLRVDYYDHPWFSDQSTFGRGPGDQSAIGCFGQRSPGTLQAIANEFERLPF